MDLYDPQTLGIMVFGGFMFISALGIVLVSTFSMKETSYEEALAQQRRELGKMAPPSQLTKKDKKKDKVSEKKNRGKKKDDKPNGKLPESEPEKVPVAVPEPTPAPERVTAPAPAPERVTAPAPAPERVTAPAPAPERVTAPAPAPERVTAPAPAPEPTTHPAPVPTAVEAPPVPAPKEKKKKEKKVAKVEPAQATTTPIAPSKPAPVLEAVTKEVPVMAVPPVGSQQTAAKAQEARAQEARAQEARAQEARAQEARAQEARAQEARAQEARAQEAQNPSKKKASSKKKAESAIPVDSGLDSPLYLPYRALVSTVSSMVISQGEAQRLIEILSDKAGIRQDTWHMATQKGDPVAVMKKQLEENQKQLATQQEDATAAKNRLRELTKELSAEKSKVASVETRLSSQLSSREQEMIALQARMQASYQDHVAQTQKLTAKVISLQEQLESGPTAQLACLQQENSILRDALNQATSQAESKQNAELAKLREDCARLTKELGERSESLQADEKVKRGLETKVSSVEKQLTLLQASHVESEQVLQRRLEEVSEELRSSQSTLEKAQQDATSLSDIQVHLGRIEADLKERSAQVEALTAQLEQTELEKGQLEDQVESINVLLEASHNRDVDEDTEMWSWSFLNNTNHLSSSLQDKDSQLASLQQELKQLQEMKQEASVVATAETECPPNSEEASLVTSLQEELKQLKEEMEQLKNSPADVTGETEQLLNRMKERTSQEVKQLKETSEQAQSSIASDNTAELAVLQTRFFISLAERDAMMASLQVELREARDQSQKVQETLAQVQQSQESEPSTELPELLEKLKEAEDSHGTLQAECDQYRMVLAETEGMLKCLQKSVEDEELVWKSKIADSEDQLKKALEQVHTLKETAESLKAENQSIEQLKDQLMLLEAQLEKQSETVPTEEEMAPVRGQLSEAMMCAQSQVVVPETRAQNSQSEPELKVQSQLNQTTEEFEQAQKTVAELQAQLDLLKEAGDSPQADTEDVAQLKERLQKERKLIKDLGQAATKLQQLLKSTQEQLAKERNKHCTLQDHSDETKSTVLKEGTSV
ncbi:ribosome-binding protein 1-like isoform X1 [Oncorhynchus masou masou]|uniref:ribosome-binding protein 1-like isoform X1 n=1 Tax=Oncorhynchus masou masou TaxID=90313 RepID=UPI003183AF73